MQHSILQTNIQQSSATTEMLPESKRFQRRYLAVLTTEELQETEHKVAEHDEIYEEDYDVRQSKGEKIGFDRLTLHKRRNTFI